MKYSWPILGIGKTPGIFISQYFGENEQLYGPGGHTGIDIAAPEGTPILAAVTAPVIHATENYIVGGKNYGKYVRQGWKEGTDYCELIYGHMTSEPWGEVPYNQYNLNQVCGVEQEIGKVGHTGFVISQGGLGNHLHFELRINGKAVDPLPLMKILIHFVGWTDKEKGVYIGFDTLGRMEQVFKSIPALNDYQFDPAEWNLGRRPWPK